MESWRGPAARPGLVAVLVLSGMLAVGCTTTATVPGLSSFGDDLAGLQMPAKVEYYPDDKVLPVAKNHFRQKNYGYAARYYEKAVELFPNDAEAWLGLAASYDQIRRFDLADNAYRKLAELIGGRAEYYNNIGYSYLLRGDLMSARKNFLKAYELDPNNITAANNLTLLRNSARTPQRGLADF